MLTIAFFPVSGFLYGRGGPRLALCLKVLGYDGRHYGESFRHSSSKAVNLCLIRRLLGWASAALAVFVGIQNNVRQ
ncbi:MULTISPECIES: hypothetical protein [Oceanibaculum]|uniref:hypothetical protein n=1 Tax=Oceanibaculum TaxID=659693 RepID=UPI0011C48480|nr:MULTISPECIES: hypothetical protein [Oceanibaculum]MCH2394137.1 hypothetical protein [Oceanibaculum sp.]